MARIGYARVSTADQNLDAQVDMLEKAGCDRIFAEKISGKLSQRPEMDAALNYLREGDTLVITKLDRLGRSVKNLIEIAGELEASGIHLVAVTQGIDTTTPMGRFFFHTLAAIAQLERDLIVERTLEGLTAARARGRKGGRPPKMTVAKAKMARSMYDSKEYTLQEIADALGVSRTTIYTHLAATASVTAPAPTS